MEKYDKFIYGFAIGAVSVGAISYLTQKLSCSKCPMSRKKDQYLFDEVDTRKILVCGSGMMVSGLVSYLMRNKNNRVTIASNILEQAKEIADKYPGR